MVPVEMQLTPESSENECNKIDIEDYNLVIDTK